MAQDTLGSTIGTNTGSEKSGKGSMNTGGRQGNSGSSSHVGPDFCPTCGRDKTQVNSGLEQFLGRLGINEEMVTNLKSSMQNVDLEEYLNTARQYLSEGTGKAKSYAKENPFKVAAGVTVLAVGTVLLISALNRD